MIPKSIIPQHQSNSPFKFSVNPKVPFPSSSDAKNNSSQFNHIKCISGKNCKQICFNQLCQQYPITCQDTKCQCKQKHEIEKICGMINPVILLKKIKHKLNFQAQNIYQCIQSSFNKLIKEIQVMKNQLKNRINMSNELSKQQMQFTKFFQYQNQSLIKINGSKVYAAYKQSINQKNNQSNQSKAKQIIDQIQNFWNSLSQQMGQKFRSLDKKIIELQPLPKQVQNSIAQKKQNQSGNFFNSSSTSLFSKTEPSNQLPNPTNSNSQGGLFSNINNKGISLFGQPNTNANKVDEFKLLLVGDGGVGKTVFKKRHLNGQFEQKYIATMGVQVNKLTFETNQGPIVLNVWDTAGQQKLGGLRDGYYIGAHAAIIMCDLTSKLSIKSIQRWYKQVTRVTDSIIPFIIVGNKSDCQDSYFIETDYVQLLNKVIPYCNISVKDNYQITAPINAILQKLMNNEQLRLIKDEKSEAASPSGNQQVEKKQAITKKWSEIVHNLQSKNKQNSATTN